MVSPQIVFTYPLHHAKLQVLLSYQDAKLKTANSTLQFCTMQTVVLLWQRTKWPTSQENFIPKIPESLFLFEVNTGVYGWTKKNWLERDLNLRPPDWRAGALPTQLSSPTLAVSLFCQYLCSGAPVRSHETIYCPLARDHAQVTIQVLHMIVSLFDLYERTSPDSMDLESFIPMNLCSSWWI